MKFLYIRLVKYQKSYQRNKFSSFVIGTVDTCLYATHMHHAWSSGLSTLQLRSTQVLKKMQCQSPKLTLAASIHGLRSWINTETNKDEGRYWRMESNTLERWPAIFFFSIESCARDKPRWFGNKRSDRTHPSATSNLHLCNQSNTLGESFTPLCG